MNKTESCRNVDDGTSKFLHFDQEEITSEILEIAKSELGETLESRKEIYEDFVKEILKCDWEGYTPCTDEYFLLRFLRVSKFHVPKALQRLKKYQEFIKKYLENFAEICSRGCQQTDFDAVWTFSMPYRCSNGSVLVIFQPSKWDTKTITFMEYFILGILRFEIALENPVNQICGITLIVDFQNLTLEHVRNLCSLQALPLYNSFQNCFPCRVRAYHFVNVPKFCQHIYNVIKHFLSVKMRERFIVHSDLESLHRYIPKDILPEEYDGKLPPLERSELKISHAKRIETMKRFVNRHLSSSINS